MALDLVLIGGAAVWVVLDRRRATRARERMQRAELDRIEAERRSVESDLQALQARVEPQFLFNTLAQVHDLYRNDAARGERMLDELIAYLRAAMPLMRDTSSTLAQELELVRAYLAIVKVRLGDRLDYATDAPAGGGEIRMPPMMLLPLVDHAIAHGIERCRAGGRLRVVTETSGDRIALSIADSGAGFLPEGGDAQIAEIRSRLAAVYGDRATLTLRRRESAASEAVLDIPLERVATA
jgi:LytS/YehU family sensor histidine kinase